MKKLINLNQLNGASLMDEAEMKAIVGGYELPEVTIYGCHAGPGAKIRACEGKPIGDKCCIYWNNENWYGRCITDQFNQGGQLYCSDVFYG